MDIETSEAWIAYLEIRKAKNRLAPFTEKARERVLSKLRMFAADGQNPEEVLWTSVENGWTGVFPAKRQAWHAPAPSLTVASKDMERSQQWIDEHSAPIQSSAEKHAAQSARLRAAKAKLTGAA